MNKILRRLALVTVIALLPAAFVRVQAQGDAQGGPGGGGPGGGRGPGGGGRGRGGSFVPTGPAGALAGRTDIYTSTNGTESVGKKTAAGEQFFIIGSVDQAQQQVLLKWPTEVTLLLKISPSTTFVSEGGKPLKLSDFRAGDTVWVVYSGEGADAAALRVRAGIMNVQDLHKYYLDYGVINGN
jgi:hypothetical protein